MKGKANKQDNGKRNPKEKKLKDRKKQEVRNSKNIWRMDGKIGKEHGARKGRWDRYEEEEVRMGMQRSVLQKHMGIKEEDREKEWR